MSAAYRRASPTPTTATGTVTFAAANAGRAAVTLSGKYLPVSVAAGAKSYTWTLEGANLDTTDFDGANSSGGLMTRIQAQKDASGTLGRNWTVDTYFRDALLAGTPVVIEFYSDRSLSPDLTVWAL